MQTMRALVCDRELQQLIDDGGGPPPQLGDFDVAQTTWAAQDGALVWRRRGGAATAAALVVLVALTAAAALVVPASWRAAPAGVGRPTRLVGRAPAPARLEEEATALAPANATAGGFQSLGPSPLGGVDVSLNTSTSPPVAASSPQLAAAAAPGAADAARRRRPPTPVVAPVPFPSEDGRWEIEGDDDNYMGDRADPAEGPVCFPGEATVVVRRRGGIGGGQQSAAPLDALRVGDEVLVERRGRLALEPVLGFIHATPSCAAGGAGCRHAVIAHEGGELRISDHHLVFARRRLADLAASAKAVAVPASELRPGDSVRVATWDGPDGSRGRSGISMSVVSALRRGQTSRGMFAPLTAAGTVVIDGVVASIYAGAPGLRPVPHGAAHAAFFFLRAYYMLTLPSPLAPLVAALRSLRADGDAAAAKAGLHPFANFLFHGLRLDSAFAAA